MAKGDDALRRKRNKSERKRLRKDSTVSARIASIIASKRRRQAGKRRICEGMCFTLPTPEDPFNDRFDKKNNVDKKLNKPAQQKADMKLSSNQKRPLPSETLPDPVVESVEAKILKKLKTEKMKIKASKLAPANGNGTGTVEEKTKRLNGNVKGGLQNANVVNPYSLSKFAMLCLTEIQKSWVQEGTFAANKDKSLIADAWGIQFWKCCSSGSNILEVTGAGISREQMAWVASTASDIVTRKEKEGTIVASPFFLYLVAAQEKAIKVRSICKPLKALGIHTVSLHNGAALDHQVHGLKSCEPEFLVSTLERLLELVSLKAIDISGVSLLVIDGLEGFLSLGLSDVLKAIRRHILGDPQTVVFTTSYGEASASLARDISIKPFYRLSSDDNVYGQSL